MVMTIISADCYSIPSQYQINPYATGGQFGWYKIMQKTRKVPKNDWNPAKWVLIGEYFARAFQWIPTWQGLDGFQKYLRLSVLDGSSLSKG